MNESFGWMTDAPALLAASVLVTVLAAVRGAWSPCGLSMISAINPFSERARGHRYPATAGWFVAGALAGGAVLGAGAAVGAWLASAVPVPVAVTVIAVCALVTVASDVGPISLPGHPRQVNEHWLGRYRRWAYASGFGFQIGTGFATYIMTAAVYLVPALGVLSGSPPLALALGVVFGLVRGLAVLISAGATDPGRLLSLHQRLARLGPWSMRAALFGEALVVLAFGAALGWRAAALGAAGLAAIGLAARIADRGRAGTTASELV